MSQGATGQRAVGWLPGHPGITLLSVTKFLDAGTTAVGLLFVPGLVEKNPVAAALFERLGIVPGLLFTSVAVVTLVIAVTELAVWWLRRSADIPTWAPDLTRTVGYLPPSLIFTWATASNAALLCGRL